MAVKENAEMFVQGRKQTKYTLLAILMIVICAIILLAMAGFLGVAAIILAVPVVALFAFFSWRFFTKNFYEYEYSIIAGVFEISRITNRTRRKLILTLDPHEISEFGIIPEINAEQYMINIQNSGRKYIDCTGIVNNDGVSETENAERAEQTLCYFEYREDDSGTVTVLFSPDRTFLDALKIRSPEVLRACSRKV